SPFIIFAGNEYYILGQITANSPQKNSIEAVDKFVNEFQDTYDTYGMAGHFRIAESDVLWSEPDSWPMPPWVDKPYVPPQMTDAVTLVRIALDGAKAVYWGWRASTEDYDDK